MRNKRLVAVVATLALLAVVALAGTALAEETPSTSGSLALPQVFLDKLAAALGIDRGTLDAAIRDASEQTVDEAAAQGVITQDQASQIKERLQQRAEQGGVPFWGHMGWGRGHMRGWGAGTGAGAGFYGCPHGNPGVQTQQLN